MAPAPKCRRSIYTGSDNVKAERTNYYDVGFSHQANSRLTVTADAYYKKIRNMLDEGQFGQALILSPFNYGQGYAKGLELSAIYSEKNWGGYLNVATQKAQGTNIVSGQALFDTDEMAYDRQPLRLCRPRPDGHPVRRGTLSLWRFADQRGLAVR
jgi:outer membrane receptor protein involved in Fe transport